MADLTATFETGVHGNNVATADAGSGDAWNVVQITSPGTLKYDNTIFYGALGAKLTSSTATSGIHMAWTTAFPTVTDHYGRIYVYFPTSFSGMGIARQIATSSGGLNAAQLRINNTGKVELIDGTNAIRATSTNSLNTGAWTRLEYRFIHSTTVGQMECKIFLSPDSATPTETLTTTAAWNTRANADEIYFGCTFGSPNGHNAFWIDNIVANATAYPGPAGGGATTVVGVPAIAGASSAVALPSLALAPAAAISLEVAPAPVAALAVTPASAIALGVAPVATIATGASATVVAAVAIARGVITAAVVNVTDAITALPAVSLAAVVAPLPRILLAPPAARVEAFAPSAQSGRVPPYVDVVMAMDYA